MLHNMLLNYFNSLTYVLIVLVPFVISGDDTILVSYMITYPVQNVLDSVSGFFGVLTYSNPVRFGVRTDSMEWRSIVFSGLICIYASIFFTASASIIVFRVIGSYWSNVTFYMVICNVCLSCCYYLMHFSIRDMIIAGGDTTVANRVGVSINCSAIVISAVSVLILGVRRGLIITSALYLILSSLLFCSRVYGKGCHKFTPKVFNGARYGLAGLSSISSVVTSVTAVLSNALLSTVYLAGEALIYLCADPVWDGTYTLNSVYLRMADRYGSREKAYSKVSTIWVKPQLVMALIFAATMVLTDAVSRVGWVVMVEVAIVILQGRLTVCYAYWSTVASGKALAAYSVACIAVVPLFTALFRFPYSNEVGWLVKDCVCTVVLAGLCRQEVVKAGRCIRE